MTFTEHIQPLLDKRLPAALVAGLLIASGAPAAERDHLMPEDSPISGQFDTQQGYDALVTASFARVYQRDVSVRMIVLPSFHPEYAVAMEHGDNGSYRILFLRPEVMLWSYPILGMMKSGQIKVAKNAFGKDAVADPKFEKDDGGIAKLEAELPRDPHDVKVDVCEREIDSALAGDIRDVWEGVAYRTRYDMPVRSKVGEETVETVTLTADGDHYHFSMSGLDTPAGQIVDPDPQSDPGRLLAVATAMQAYCAHPEKENLTALTRAVDTLKKQLSR